MNEQLLANVTRSCSSRSTTESCSTSVYISKGRNPGMAAQRAEHGIGDVPHARLNRQERFGNHSAGQLGRQKFGDIVADGFRQRADLAEAARFVFQIGFHHAHDLRRVDCDDRRADAVGRRVNRNLLAIRRIGRLVDIVQPEDAPPDDGD